MSDITIINREEVYNLVVDLEKMGFLTTLGSIEELHRDWIMRFLV